MPFKYDPSRHGELVAGLKDMSPETAKAIFLGCIQAANEVGLNGDWELEGHSGAVLYLRRLISISNKLQVPGIDEGFIDEYGVCQDFTTNFYADLVEKRGLTYIDEHGRLALLDSKRIIELLHTRPVQLQLIAEKYVDELLEYLEAPPRPPTH